MVEGAVPVVAVVNVSHGTLLEALQLSVPPPPLVILIDLLAVT